MNDDFRTRQGPRSQRFPTGNKAHANRDMLPEVGLAGARHLTREECDAVRNRLVEYARTIPCFESDDFRSLLAVPSGSVVPVYRIRLQTLYETRRYTEKMCPYTGGRIPPLCISSDVDMWGFSLPEYFEFINTVREHSLEGSQRVVDCGDCAGAGHVPCEGCNGAGIVVCGQCGRAGTVTQQRWAGQRRRKCLTCWGKGHLNWGLGGAWLNSLRESGAKADSTCSSCGGHGYVMEDVVETVSVRCPTCGGAGVVPCATCTGRGRVTCGVCQGAQRLVASLALVQEFSAKETSGTVSAVAVSVDVDNLVQPGDFFLLAEKCCQTFPRDPEQTAGFRSGQERVANSLRELQEVIFKEVTPACRITMQRLALSETPLVVAHYAYGGKEYDIFLAGADDRVLMSRSPFSDFTQQKIDEAISLWRENRMGAAVTAIQQAWEIAKIDASSKSVFEGAQIPLVLKTVAKAGAVVSSFKSAVTKLFGRS